MWRSTIYNTSKVTIELRDIVKDGVNIWDFEYDGFYSGEMKKAFELKVIDHYYFRQIGFETVGRFLHAFRTKIREIMPLYKQLYESELLMKKQTDPFESYWLEETFTTEKTGSGTASATGSGSGSSSDTSTTTDNAEMSTETTNTSETTENKIHKFSNTPQSSISNLDNGYLTEASKDNNTVSVSDTSNTSNTSENTSKLTASSSNESTSTQTAESSSTESETHTLLRRGNIGVQSLGDEVNKLRKSFINIDMMIINELQDLFLQVY